jgi:hypothetical protein
MDGQAQAVGPPVCCMPPVSVRPGYVMALSFRQTRFKTCADAIRSRARFDVLIAAVAVSLGVPLITRNQADFRGIHDTLDVIPV